MPWKKSLLVINKIVRLLVKTLTADDKHYLLNRENLAQPIQIQLSENKKSSMNFGFAFLKSVLNFKHLSKKKTLTADVIPEIPSPKNTVR